MGGADPASSPPASRMALVGRDLPLYVDPAASPPLCMDLSVAAMGGGDTGEGVGHEHGNDSSCDGRHAWELISCRFSHRLHSPLPPSGSQGGAKHVSPIATAAHHQNVAAAPDPN
ncbi:Os10g0334750 [Oryza sativa Japonica Group]|uniref:Os10g0334750 protein n=1 Tax=Oryza sativa subsp. japonica TaxID=39947 RepID=A0A0N7KRL8_ORYSJ|nr:Os10g0334750 [Oryza sativa Japonica Group]